MTRLHYSNNFLFRCRCYINYIFFKFKKKRSKSELLIDFKGTTANVDQIIYSNVQMEKVRKNVKPNEVIYAEVDKVEKIPTSAYRKTSDQHLMYGV